VIERAPLSRSRIGSMPLLANSLCETRITFRTKDSEIQTTASMNCVAVGSLKKEG
jgi:hypothetical protein